MQNIDSITVAKKLIGKWSWVQKSCYWTGNTITPADKNITVIFFSDKRFTVKENTTILTQGQWSLFKIVGHNWELDLDNSNEYLHGQIIFCDQTVMFYDSYKDGCDNLFKLVNRILLGTAYNRGFALAGRDE